MTDNTETPQTTIIRPYEKNGVYIKNYLSRRYNTDPEWREKTNKQRGVNQRLKYQTDPIYRAKVLEQRRVAYLNKKLTQSIQSQIAVV
jgi:hypothetical protein